MDQVYFEGLTAQEHPYLIAIGGGPASGKTTYRRRIQVDLENYFLHDMDEVIVRLAGYQKDVRELGAKAAFEHWWPIARQLADEWVSVAIESKYSILYDRTCGAQKSYEDLKRAKEIGYTVQLIGMTCDRSVALGRAQRRELEEGRATPVDILDEYRARFSALWPRYLEFVDEALLYDTTETPPILIYSSEKGILDEELYQKFLGIGKSFSLN